MGTGDRTWPARTRASELARRVLALGGFHEGHGCHRVVARGDEPDDEAGHVFELPGAAEAARREIISRYFLSWQGFASSFHEAATTAYRP